MLERDYWRRVRKRAWGQAQATFRIPGRAQLGILLIADALTAAGKCFWGGVPAMTQQLWGYAAPAAIWGVLYGVAFLYYYHRAPAEMDRIAGGQIKNLETMLEQIRTAAPLTLRVDEPVRVDIGRADGEGQGAISVTANLSVENNSETSARAARIIRISIERRGGGHQISNSRILDQHFVNGQGERRSELKALYVPAASVVPARIVRTYWVTTETLLALDHDMVVRLWMDAMLQPPQAIEIPVDWDEKRSGQRWLKARAT